VRVILRQPFEQLGQLGDIVEVKEGYARNYLIPRKIAYPATEGYLKTLEEEKKQLARRQQKELRTAEKLAADLEKVSLTIPMKVGEEDKLFGAVTPQMIAEYLAEKGFEVDKRKIELGDQIKALGVYSVDVRLHSNVTAKVKVWVVKE
jgi:large subunit ribosomal protein L9